MARIEQNPDGTYAKRMTDTEQKTLKLIYKEQNDRAAADNTLQLQINALTTQLTTATNDLTATKTKLSQTQVQLTADEQTITLLQTQYTQLTQKLQAKGVI